MSAGNGENHPASSRAGGRRAGPKCIAIVGPLGTGKTTLLEAILARTGAIGKQSPVASGNTVGDHSAEARSHQMSVEASIATTEFIGEALTFIDCPGSVEFAHEADAVLAGCDLAIVVAEADEAKFPALQMVMRKLAEAGVPRVIFLNKIDRTQAGIRDTLKLLQPYSETPLMVRQIPIRQGGIVVGAIDLALERAHVYREHAESEVAEIPGEDKARELEARFEMLEKLADHDDALMEELLEDIEPPLDQVFDDLSSDLRAGHITPVLIGSAEHGNGVLRLLKTIRHDAPGIEDTRARLGVDTAAEPLVQVMKTIHTTHGGKLSLGRVLAGGIKDGSELIAASGEGVRVSGLYRLFGKETKPVSAASAGDTVALGKLDPVATGETLGGGRAPVAQAVQPARAEPVYSMVLKPMQRKDDVRLSAALKRLAEEDPGLTVEHDAESGDIIVHGQGEMHLRVTVERLEGKYQIAVARQPPAIPYRETIRKGITQRARHKKQSGGHGQFGDVVIDIRPLPRGEGFAFSDTITGGVVPKQYIPSVETGVRDYLARGPLGFPVVDVAVNLSDGSYHSVDSSDMAFQMAAKHAMREAMPNCSPVLLEPVMKVAIVTPSDATARITALIPQRRGRILGFDARPGWPGWDQVDALMPQAEIGDLIIELRSATAGVASYSAQFDHMAELTGRAAEDAVAKAGGEAA
ncbi:MAG: elongation factor G [Pseudomonadota bacterium]|nr:elongation factor G [Pseudomonadota bacterium]